MYVIKVSCVCFLAVILDAFHASCSLDEFEPLTRIVEPKLDAPDEEYPRIWNATGVAERGQIPYQAHIIVDNTFEAAGALISPEWVLTTADTIFNYHLWKVVLGTVNLTDADPDTVTVETIEAIVHPLYDPSYFTYNNIGLIKLSFVIPINRYIRPVLLPPRSMEFYTFEGEMAVVSGFGYIAPQGPISTDLLYANLTVISNEECERYYAGIGANALCAEGISSICPGDIGGPLVHESFVIGLSSFLSSAGCNSTMFPSGFTRVTSYIDWISDATGIAICNDMDCY